MDDLSRMKYKYTMTEEKEILSIYRFEKAKKRLNMGKLWSVIERQKFSKINVHLDDMWFKYLFQLLEI